MAARKAKKSSASLFFPAQPDLPDHFSEALALAAVELGGQFDFGVVAVTTNQVFSEYWKSRIKPWGGGKWPSRLVVIWQTGVPDAMAMLSWRSGVIEESKYIFESRMIIVPDFEPPDWVEWLRDQLDDWSEPPPPKEDGGFEVGSRVIIRSSAGGASLRGYEPAFLTLGSSRSMQVVLTQLDRCKQRYRSLIGKNVGERRERVLTELDKVLSYSSIAEEEWAHLQKTGSRRVEKLSFTEFQSEFVEDIKHSFKRELNENEFEIDRVALPRILILGESGVGKTLVARYLAWRTSPDDGGALTRPFKRVPIPQYSHNEGAFEADVFGCCEGSYTDQKTYSRGFLFEHLGGVVFFDEIGEANPAIQSKLLAYLDDYKVRPKGWVGESFSCPTLVVAATNRPIDRLAEEEANGGDQLFRNDLFQRFNVVVRFPSLAERIDEIEQIADAMLQMEALNPGGVVRQVGGDALQTLRKVDYRNRNFRALERMLSTACHRAARQSRDYLVAGDILD